MAAGRKRSESQTSQVTHGDGAPGVQHSMYSTVPASYSGRGSGTVGGIRDLEFSRQSEASEQSNRASATAGSSPPELPHGPEGLGQA